MFEHFFFFHRIDTTPYDPRCGGAWSKYSPTLHGLLPINRRPHNLTNAILPHTTLVHTRGGLTIMCTNLIRYDSVKGKDTVNGYIVQLWKLYIVHCPDPITIYCLCNIVKEKTLFSCWKRERCVYGKINTSILHFNNTLTSTTEMSRQIWW